MQLLGIPRHYRTIFLGLITLDLFILLLHMLFGQHSWFFHVDFENNLPTVYQAVKLLAFGILFFYLSFSLDYPKKLRAFTVPLALIIWLLGFDELVQVHENIYRIFEFIPGLTPAQVVDLSLLFGYRSSLWMLYYLPAVFIFVLWCGYWLRYFQAKIKPNYLVLVVSCAALFVVLYTELLSSTGLYDESAYLFLVTTEETAEMLFATTIIFVGLKVFNQRK